jgi:hypothetical protein
VDDSRLCNVCGCPAATSPLMSEFQSLDIRDVCPECETLIDQHHSTLVGYVASVRAAKLSQFIEQLRQQKKGSPS